MRNRKFDPNAVVKGKKYLLSQDDIDKVREDAKKSQELLDNSYLQSYFTQAKGEILDINAKRLLQDTEESKEQDGVKKTIKFTAEKEYELLAGQFRFMDAFLNDLQQNIEIAKMLEEKLASGEVEVSEDVRA